MTEDDILRLMRHILSRRANYDGSGASYAVYLSKGEGENFTMERVSEWTKDKEQAAQHRDRLNARAIAAAVTTGRDSDGE